MAERLAPHLDHHPTRSIARLLKRLGDEEGIEVDLEPEWEFVGRIRRVDDRFTYFRGAHFGLNGMGAMEISKDKAYAAYFLEKGGYRAIPGRSFCSEDFANFLKVSEKGPSAACEYARSIGFPVIVKPNSQSQGREVSVVENEQALMEAIARISKIDRVFLIQTLVTGRDYRVVVLDDQVMSAYERLPLTVIGDGTSTVDQLLEKRQAEFTAIHRDTVINADDIRITARLARVGSSRSTVLPKGESLPLLDNRNLSTGGEAVDITDTIHSTYRDLCVGITRDMGLRYCGVDLMVSGDARNALNDGDNNYHVIEINSAPGIDNYAKSGPEQERIVEGLYRRILKVLAGKLT